MRGYLWYVFPLALLACANEEQPTGRQFEEIPAQAAATADIIRNPITADAPTDTVNIARLTFEETTFDFGLIEPAAQVEHTYNFVNTGRAPLLISDARSTCGCTVPDWPRQPINPGESGSIRVRFDATDRVGRQHKPIVITANTYPATTELYLTGEVMPSPEG